MVVQRLAAWHAAWSGVVLAASLWVGGCAGTGAAPPPAAVEAPADPAARPPLWVGVSKTAPPLIFEQDGQPAGLEADLARDLAEALGRELKFVPTYWPNLIPELRARRIDVIMSGMTVTPQRQRQVAFAQPYLATGQQALVRRGDLAALGSSAAITGTRRAVGVEKGTTGERFAREHLADAAIYPLPTLEAATKALLEGGVDVVINDSPSICWMARKHRDDGLVAVPGLFTAESLAWAVHPEDADLLEALNGVLRQWQENGKLAAILARWIDQGARP